MTQYRTTAALNLRGGPGTDEDILTTLPKGHAVELLDDLAEHPGWWQVSTSLRGADLRGYVSAAYLRPAADAPAQPSGQPPAPIPPVHMPNTRPHVVTRAGTRRAYALNEAGRPTGDLSADQLWSIADWLDVENGAHTRYQPVPGGATYCNIYAYDLCCLAGQYLPRVWWRKAAIAKLRQGQAVRPVYDDTIHELNANALHDWLAELGPEFGWQRSESLTEAQNAANGGTLAAIVATTGTAASGHITILLPERGAFAARRSGNRVIAPLQSQAGRHNFKAHTNAWWDSSAYQAWGTWIAR